MSTAPALPPPARARRVAAFFDLDRTLIACNSGEQWIGFLRRRREISAYRTLRAMAWALEYKLGVLDFDRVSERVVRGMAGDDEAEMWAKCREFVAGLLPEVTDAARRALERHRDAGDLLVLLTSSTQFTSELFASALDIPHVLCTRLGVAEGVFTGTLERPVCYGTGKIYWAERFALEHGVDLGQSVFYSDSWSDVPMLARAGRRVVVNPDPRLARYARRVGWPIERW